MLKLSVGTFVDCKFKHGFTWNTSSRTTQGQQHEYGGKVNRLMFDNMICLRVTTHACYK